MDWLSETFDRAVQSHQSGNVQQAEYLYRQVLQQDPRHVDALRLLGLLAHQLGRHDLAVEHLRHALSLQPGFPEAHNNLGMALVAQGKLPEAEASYRQALALRPDFAEAHNNLGIALTTAARLDEAVTSWRQALHCQPNYVEALSNLGVVLTTQGQLDEAITNLQQALRLAPEFPQAHYNLGNAFKERGNLAEAETCYRRAIEIKSDYAEAHNNLGTMLAAQENLHEAIASWRQALQIFPNYPEAYNNLGLGLSKLRRPDEAVAALEQAIRLKPNYPEAYANLGMALKDQGMLDEAEAMLRQALSLKPDHADAHNNLGATLSLSGRLDEAVQHFHKGLSLQPDNAEFHQNLGIACLALGDFERGWPEFEWRLRCKKPLLPPLALPRWEGSPLPGRTILLRAEQGLGDTLQFVRYAAMVRERVATVVLACQPALLPLLSQCRCVDRVVPWDGPLPVCDVQAPLMSLPAILGTTLADVPSNVPYLDADAKLVDRWRDELRWYPGFKIGIAWQGNRDYPGDRSRSIPLAEFAPLASIGGTTLISLQKGAGSEQLGELRGRFPIIDLSGRLDETSGAFMDTAAVMKNLDLVVTSDSAIAHLAGALGVRVWLALPFAADWRWLQQRADSPWYPTMRLFRQARRGDWPEVFQRMAAELRKVPPSSGEPEATVGVTQAAMMHNDWGVALADQGRLDQAVASYQQALSCHPNFAEAHNNMAIALKDLGRVDEAAAGYREALRLKPNFAEAQNNLGVLLAEQGQLEEAEACYRRALHLKPDFAGAHNNLGNVLADLGRLEEGMAGYRQALLLQPDYPDARKNLGMAHLLRGEFEPGWREYEWRLWCKEPLLPAIAQLRWDGKPLAGRTVLLFAEQGLGDTLQFVRFAPLVRDHGGRVVLACQPALLPLLSRSSGIDQFVSLGGPLPPFDVHAPLLSVPGIIGTTVGNVPATVPYLHSDPLLVEHWRQELSRYPGFKIGIAWQGNPKYRGDCFRSIPLAEFAPLARVAGARLINLQKCAGVEQLRGVRHTVDLGSLDDSGAFLDTAAIMQDLDLVVTSDSAIAHLAGALGVRVWLALPFVPDWRWLLERDDSPWYPTLRLFRQKQRGNWGEVFERIAAEAATLQKS